jgi:hypothetical protein
MWFSKRHAHLAACIFLALFTLAGCGGGGGGQSSPVPSLTSINPSSAPAGSPVITINATGSNFISSSIVEWDNVALATSYVNSTTLTAQISAGDLQTAGTATVTVTNPAPGGTSNGLNFVINPTSNPVPILVSISPSSASVGSSATTITLSGADFVPSSFVEWNNVGIATSYVNSTTLTAQISAGDLHTAGTATVTVTNPAPDGGTSNALNFVIGPSAQVRTVNILANIAAWDPVNQVIYLSIPSAAGPDGNSVQVLNPMTGILGTSAFVGSEPNLLSVSDTSQYLYVSLNGASTVQVMALPALSNARTIDLGSDPFDGPFYAMDLQAAPSSDSLVAVVRGTPGTSPEEEGGVVIYNSGTALPNVLCGWIQTGCPNLIGGLFDSIQWSSSGSEMFAANNEDTAFNFYTIQVTSSGFGTVTDYAGVFQCFGCLIHYDASTGYVYDDDGQVVNPSSGVVVGSFDASGMMVPDGTLGQAFFLGQTEEQIGSTNYTIESFDITTFTPIASLTISNVIGPPTSFIRWGSSGLAFTVNNEGSPAVGAVYLIGGAFVSEAADQPRSSPAENVHNTWKRGESARSGGLN